MKLSLLNVKITKWFIDLRVSALLTVNSIKERFIMRHLSDYHVVWAGVKSKISDSQKSVFLSAPTSPSLFFSILSFDEFF